MNTFLTLSEKPACRVLLNGGEFSAENTTFTPIGCHNLLETLCPNKAFISASGIDAWQGVTCYNVNELAMKHQALARCATSYLVADSTKFGKVLPARIGELSQFQTLISDRPPAGPLSEILTEQGIALHTLIN